MGIRRGTDADSLKLKEYRLDNYGTATHKGTTKILKGSSLAAYWHPDKKKPFVIYQDADSNNLYEYNVADNERKLYTILVPVIILPTQNKNRKPIKLTQLLNQPIILKTRPTPKRVPLWP